MPINIEEENILLDDLSPAAALRTCQALTTMLHAKNVASSEDEIKHWEWEPRFGINGDSGFEVLDESKHESWERGSGEGPFIYLLLQDPGGPAAAIALVDVVAVINRRRWGYLGWDEVPFCLSIVEALAIFDVKYMSTFMAFMHTMDMDHAVNEGAAAANILTHYGCIPEMMPIVAWNALSGIGQNSDNDFEYYEEALKLGAALDTDPALLLALKQAMFEDLRMMEGLWEDHAKGSIDLIPGQAYKTIHQEVVDAAISYREELDWENPYEQKRLGSRFLNQDDAAAVVAYRRAIELFLKNGDPKSRKSAASCCIEIAEVFLRLQRRDEIEALLVQALDLLNQGEQRENSLVRDLSSIANLFTRILDKRGFELYEQLFQKYKTGFDPGRGKIVMAEYATALAQVGREREAAEKHAEYLELLPHFSNPVKADIAEDPVASIVKEFEEMKRAGFEEVNAKDASYYVHWMNVGICYKIAGEMGKALEAYEKAVIGMRSLKEHNEQGQNYYRVLVNYANCLRDLGHIKNGLAIAQEVCAETTVKDKEAWLAMFDK